jgi:hypothetical protein
MKKINNLIFLFLLFLVSCNNNKKESENIAETLSVDLDKISDVSFSDLFTKMEIVPLETRDESLLSDATKYAYNEKEKCYFVFDNRQQVLFCFDENGKFKFSSAHLKGSGPEEYAIGQDFNYNPFSFTYEILDFPDKINIYDKNLKFIKRLSGIGQGVLAPLCSFMPLNKDMYALYNHDNNDEEDRVYLYDISVDTIKETFHLQRLFNYISNSLQPFTITNSQVYFLPSSFSNTLYRIDLESFSLVPVLNVDYGKKALPENIIENYKKDSKSTLSFFTTGSRDYAYTRDITQNEYIFCIISQYNNNYFRTIYDKNSKKISTFSNFSNNIFLPEPFLLTNNIWYSCTSVSNIDSAINMDYLTEESKLRLSQIKEDDNPVIVKYYLK